jgi:hypothetical protein
MAEKPAIPGLDAPLDQKSDVLAKALEAGKWGAAGGAGLGALSSLVSGEGNYLRNTLAGALLGGGATGGFAAYQAADPFQRGGVAGTAYQKALERTLGETIGGSTLSEAGSAGLRDALISTLTGQGSFEPEEQSALVQQFTQSTLPTKKGWDRRIKLASKVADQLTSDNPRKAFRGLRVMAQVMPDVDMKTAAQHALQRIESGQTRLPEEISALAALGNRIRARLETYNQATPAVDSLRAMKSEFGSGKINPEEFAQRIGLLTGRFGEQTPEAQRLRQFLQQVIARPVSRTKPNSLMGRTMSEAPEVGDLVMSALER